VTIFRELSNKGKWIETRGLLEKAKTLEKKNIYYSIPSKIEKSESR
jgi:hypothetical protein